MYLWQLHAWYSQLYLCMVSHLSTNTHLLDVIYVQLPLFSTLLIWYPFLYSTSFYQRYGVFLLMYNYNISMYSLYWTFLCSLLSFSTTTSFIVIYQTYAINIRLQLSILLYVSYTQYNHSFNQTFVVRKYDFIFSVQARILTDVY